MNAGGEAADQMVRMSLNGVEVVAKLAGSATKNLAVLIYTILSSKEQTAGKARLASMLKSGKPLKLFSVKNSDLKLFTQEAKQYGVLYCAIKNPKDNSDGMTDLIIRAEDAEKISRIVNRFKVSAVDTDALKKELSQLQKEKAQAQEHAQASQQDAPQEQSIPHEQSMEDLVDQILGVKQPPQNEQDPEQGVQRDPYQPTTPKKEETENPTHTQPQQDIPSENSLPMSRHNRPERPSVREELLQLRKKEQIQEKGQSAPSRWNGEVALLGDAPAKLAKGKGKRVAKKGKVR